MQDDDVLSKNAYVYALMQDGSHGALRKQPVVSDEEMIEVCKIVVEFVSRKFPKQLHNE